MELFKEHVQMQMNSRLFEDNLKTTIISHSDASKIKHLNRVRFLLSLASKQTKSKSTYLALNGKITGETLEVAPTKGIQEKTDRIIDIIDIRDIIES